MPRRSPPAKFVIVALIMTVAIVAPTNIGYAAGLFTDNFETGTLNAAWNPTQAFSVQQSIKHAGSWAGRATAAGGMAYAERTIAGQTDVYLRAFVNVVSHTGAPQILRMKSSTGSGSTVSLILKSNNVLQVKNHVLGGETRDTVVTLPLGTFVDLQLHLHIGGANGAAELWVNGAPAGGLAGAWNFGTTPIDSVVLGAQASATMDVVFDNVEAATTFIGGGTPPTAPPTPTGLSATAFFDHVNLSWNASSGATGYTVYRGGVALTPTTTATSFTDNTVQPQTTYLYSVAAFNAVGPSSQTAQISVTTPPAPTGGGTVVMVAGDIACDPADTNFKAGNGTSTKCRAKHTAPLLAGADQILAIGDTQYDCGGLTAFQQSYNLSWGQSQYKSITRAILSDEDYDTSGTGCGAPGADGYFSYWGSAGGPNPGGYRSWDIDVGATNWHIVALNSECSRITGGCAEGGAQNNWLEADLAASSAQCTIALLHAPLFFSKANSSGIDSSVRPLVDDLYADGVEMVLSGDKHFYERFAPQTPSGAASPNGFVQWIVGVGGKSHQGLAAAGSRRPNSVTATASTFGVLELTLHDGSYDWDFIVEGSGSYSDAASATCH